MSKTVGSGSGKLVKLVYLPILAVLAIATAVVQPGTYSGLVQGDAVLRSSSDSSFFRFKASAPQMWRWARPRSITYDQVTLEILCEGENKLFQIDLRKNQWTSVDASGTLDESSLRRILLGEQMIEDADGNLNAQIKTFAHFLTQMGNGSLAGPRHHTYEIPKPLEGHFVHFTSGQNYAILGLLGWLLLWPLYLLLPRHASGCAGVTPRKAFVLTLAVVAVLDGVFIGIAYIFSPSTISEIMEFLIGATNLPTAFIANGIGAVFTPLGYAFSGLAWATIASTAVLLRNKGARKPEQS